METTKKETLTFYNMDSDINPSKEILKGIFLSMTSKKKVAFIDCERGYILRLTGKLTRNNDTITISKPNNIDRVSFLMSSVVEIIRRYAQSVPLTEFKIKLINGSEFKIVY